MLQRALLAPPQARFRFQGSPHPPTPVFRRIAFACGIAAQAQPGDLFRKSACRGTGGLPSIRTRQLAVPTIRASQQVPIPLMRDGGRADRRITSEATAGDEPGLTPLIPLAILLALA